MAVEIFEGMTDGKTPPTYKFFNGSEWVNSKSGKTATIVSPLDGNPMGQMQVVSTEEIDVMYANARASQKAWENTPLNARVKIMHLAADYIRHYEEYLTTLLIREIGKTTDEAKGEVKRTADIIDYFADEAQSITGETLDSDNFPGFEKGRIALIERVAHGVVLAISPFNYPINLSASKIAPALLMGNSVVFKPATQGTITGLHLVRIFEKAGLPKGLLSTATGGGSEVGNYLVSHKDLDMAAFTGSSDVGIAIAALAPMKPLLFECGGDNPAIVLPDADIQLTARELVKGAFSYAGQRCTGIKYVIATQSMIDQVLPAVLALMPESVKMGDPRSPDTKLVGPVISLSAAQKIEEAINEAISQGAKVEMGGKRNGSYIEPTILSNVKPEMKVVKTEIFGPILSFVKVENNEEAIRIVNDSVYGLQTSVFTKDEGTGLVFAKNLKTGTVQINGSPQRGPDHFPFLGVKHSGVGVQGVRYSLEAMSRLRPIILNKPQ